MGHNEAVTDYEKHGTSASSSGDPDRLAALESRLRRLEDQLEITRLIAGYGPFVDAGAADEVAGMWTDEGTYDVEGWHMVGREDVRAMVLSSAHQKLINAGSCHFLGPARVTVDGDEAVAVCASLLVLHAEGRFRVWRAGANHFSLQRTTAGWQVIRRVTRALDGTAESRRLLSDGAAGQHTDGA